MIKVAVALLASVIIGIVVTAPSAQAVNLFGNGCNGATGSVCSDIDKNGGNDAKNAAGDTISKIVNVMLYLVGGVSVLVIVAAGIQMVISSGNPEQIKRARSAIVYALVGLAVAVLGYGIVRVVLARLV